MDLFAVSYFQAVFLGVVIPFALVMIALLAYFIFRSVIKQDWLASGLTGAITYFVLGNILLFAYYVIIDGVFVTNIPWILGWTTAGFGVGITIYNITQGILNA